VAIAFVSLGHWHQATNPAYGFTLNEDTRVKSLGPAAQGKGLGQGDLLKEAGRWNRAPVRVESAFHWLRLSRDLGEGPARFVFERKGGERLELVIEPERPSLWPRAAWSLGSFLVLLTLCLILWITRRREPALAWTIVVLLNVYLVLYGFTHLGELRSSVPLFMAYLFFDLFTLPLLLHLFLRYPTPFPWVARRPRLPLLLYLPQALVTLGAAAGYLQLLEAPTLANQARVLLLGKWIIPIVFLAYLLSAMAVMIVRYLTSSPELRRQIQWIIYGGVVAGLLTAGFSLFQWRSSPSAWLLEGSSYLLPIYVLLATTIAFSFMEFRLVDVDRIVHRSLVYGLVSGLIVLVYLALAGGLGYLLTRVFGITSTTVTVLATVGSVAVFFPLRRAVQSNVDRIFFRHRTVYEEILAHASGELTTMLDLERLSKVVLEMLVTKLSRRRAVLYLAGPDRRLARVMSAGQAAPPEASPPASLPTVDSFTLRKLRAHSVGETVAVHHLLAARKPQRLTGELGAIFDAAQASILVFLCVRGRILGLVALGPKVDGSLVTRDEITMLESLGRQLAVVVQNAAAYSEIEKLSRDLARQRQEILALKNRLEAENVYLREEIQQAARFGDIIGESPGMKAALAQVARVAPTDSTVLIRGASGTGKELIARAIHDASPRSARPLVAINCAAIPEGLLESELFGHEKGAFTGATSRRRGRFELADGGTLFFDEVGDMPLSLQAKLLRALQEREILPVGAERPVAVDVRVISATHRDLAQRVGMGLFREDLYYRLNVVPIDLPPLRDRPEDIPLLAQSFASLFARRSGKALTGISRRAMERLLAYSWPGNVRELGNVIERAVVLSESSVLDAEVVLPAPDSGLPAPHSGLPAPHSGLPAPHSGPALESAPWSAHTSWAAPAPGAPDEAEPLPFHEAVTRAKREIITEAIRRAGGNKAEAARLLGLQRTYLYRLEKQLLGE
jgi:transcriptional regulator with GAF, ATPase, and Fis domain